MCCKGCKAAASKHNNNNKKNINDAGYGYMVMVW